MMPQQQQQQQQQQYNSQPSSGLAYPAASLEKVPVSYAPQPTQAYSQQPIPASSTYNTVGPVLAQQPTMMAPATTSYVPSAQEQQYYASQVMSSTTPSSAFVSSAPTSAHVAPLPHAAPMAIYPNSALDPNHVTVPPMPSITNGPIEELEWRKRELDFNKQLKLKEAESENAKKEKLEKKAEKHATKAAKWNTAKMDPFRRGPHHEKMIAKIEQKAHYHFMKAENYKLEAKMIEDQRKLYDPPKENDGKKGDKKDAKAGDKKDAKPGDKKDDAKAGDSSKKDASSSSSSSSDSGKKPDEKLKSTATEEHPDGSKKETTTEKKPGGGTSQTTTEKDAQTGEKKQTETTQKADGTTQQHTSSNKSQNPAPSSPAQHASTPNQ